MFLFINFFASDWLPLALLTVCPMNHDVQYGYHHHRVTAACCVSSNITATFPLRHTCLHFCLWGTGIGRLPIPPLFHALARTRAWRASWLTHCWRPFWCIEKKKDNKTQTYLKCFSYEKTPWNLAKVSWSIINAWFVSRSMKGMGRCEILGVFQPSYRGFAVWVSKCVKSMISPAAVTKHNLWVNTVLKILSVALIASLWVLWKC